MTADELDPAERRAQRINLPPCHVCGYARDAVTSVEDDDATPDVGAVILCIACGALTTVDDSPLGLYVRPLTPAEHRSAMTDPGVVRALEARAIAAARAGDSWWPRGAP